jgi:hypothetical protein
MRLIQRVKVDGASEEFRSRRSDAMNRTDDDVFPDVDEAGIG